ncbi:hypothetical protein PQX77_011985 [Marasmius sp. AFHP31]|nr:hypothetical protein PQX77_011985 [Marasmius sp. AFHP31]
MLLARSSSLLLCFTSLATTLAGPVQKSDLVLPPRYAGQREAVKDIFQRSYGAYRKFAFGHDVLMPVSGGFDDGRNGWGASIVDAMSTMLIMGFDEFFDEAVKFVGHIDFSKSQTNDTVRYAYVLSPRTLLSSSATSVFETTIRYLGGLLSAYELSGGKHEILLQKAKEVADKMAYAWKSHNQRIPYGVLDFSTNTPNIAVNSIAGAGTLDLEWTTLTKHTGNKTYERLTVDAVRTIANLPAPLPGLAAQHVDPKTSKFTDDLISWGGGSDSYFEYLIKYARLTNTDENLFTDTWATAVDSSVKHLLRTSTVGHHIYLADRDGTGKHARIIDVSSHLACFHGGNWIYGGRLLNNDTIVKVGLDLADACWNTYASTATGIGPEVFRFISTNKDDSSLNRRLTPAQAVFYEKHGFYITGADYILRPEVLESNFYAWRATGDHKYLDRAASAIASFNKYLPAKKTGGCAGLNNVNNPFEGQIDTTESFWFAEVLKYLYLTFDDPNHISLDEYVFNTEAHPFVAPPLKPTYGSGNLIPTTTSFAPTSIEDGTLPEISPNRFLPTPLSELLRD